MTTANRTDVHSPVNLDTANYMYLGSLDWHATVSEREHAARRALVNRIIVEPGRQWAGIHPSGQCDHCGARIRYAALLLHTPTDTVVEVGETCLANRFDLATADFQRLRKQAALDRAGQRIKTARLAFIEDHADLAWLAEQPLPEIIAWNGFVQSLAGQLQRNGTLSEAQIGAARQQMTKAQANEAERSEKKAAEAALPQAPVVEGRGVIRAVVLGVKFAENKFTGGETEKMTIRDDRGFRLYGTVPSNLDVARGSRVELTATVERSEKDEYFGFFSRPTKASVL